MPEPRPPARIEIGHLIIRRWRLSDIAALQTAVDESIEELRPWLVWAGDDRKAQGEFLAASAKAWEGGERFEYAIEDRQGALLGSVGLMRRIAPGGLETGYWVHTAQAGRGIAKLAAAALTEAAFELPGVDHVEIHHDRANLRSRAVPAGLGFEMVEETLKSELAPADSGIDLIWRIRGEAFAASPAMALVSAVRST